MCESARQVTQSLSVFIKWAPLLVGRVVLKVEVKCNTNQVTMWIRSRRIKYSCKVGVPEYLVYPSRVDSLRVDLGSPYTPVYICRGKVERFITVSDMLYAGNTATSVLSLSYSVTPLWDRSSPFSHSYWRVPSLVDHSLPNGSCSYHSSICILVYTGSSRFNVYLFASNTSTLQCILW